MINSFADLIITQKWVDTLKDESQVIFLEGPSQTSKTTLAGIKLVYEAFRSPKGQTLLFLCGESSGTLYRNFIDKETSITKLFKGAVRHVGGSQRGGERIEIDVAYGDYVETKNVYMVGYKTIASEDKILGGSPYLMLLDEANKAHPNFIKQAITRVASVGMKLIATSNGDDPDLELYSYLNACRPHEAYIDDVPLSTIEQMKEVPHKEGWSYWFFALEDRPGATAAWINRMHNTHPKGSFYYNAFVLGIRGATDGVLYGHLLKKSHIVDERRINFNSIIELQCGIDVGSGGSSATKENAKTIFVLVAYSKEYQRTIVLDAYESKEVSHARTLEELYMFLKDWVMMFGHRFRSIWIDSAERALIETARGKESQVQKLGVTIQGSIKNTKTVTAKSRVALKEQLIYNDRLLFSTRDGALEVRKQLAKVKGHMGETIDDNELHNDYNDALDYALTPNMTRLLRRR
jgi:hypothetical protein